MNIYCVYLTIYRGNRLPMFYIGSTSKAKLDLGYKGSIVSQKYKNIWNREKKSNPNLFETKIISYHETRQDAYDKEEKLQKSLNVVESPLYMNESYANKNFSMSGKPLTDDHKAKLSKIMKEIMSSPEMKLKISSNLGKKPSKETIEKLRVSCSGKIATEEIRAKMRKAWETREPVTEEARNRMSSANKKSQAITINGITYRSKRHAAQELGIDRKKL